MQTLVKSRSPQIKADITQIKKSYNDDLDLGK